MIPSFCQDLSKSNFYLLSGKEKKILLEYSHKMVDGKISTGHRRLARRIIKLELGRQEDTSPEEVTINERSDRRWRYDLPKNSDDKTGFIYSVIPKNLLLFRGNALAYKNIKRPSLYLALDPFVAANYVNFGVKIRKKTELANYKGYLQTFYTKEEVKLFRLDSLHNINGLLRQFFEKDEPMYEVLKGMFMKVTHNAGMKIHDMTKYVSYISQSETKTRPVQFHQLIRYSVLTNDIQFVEWLCKNGYQGYVSATIPQHGELGLPGSKESLLGAELVLCQPDEFITFLGEISIRAPQSYSELDQAIIKLEKNRAIHDFMEKNHYLY